MSHRDFILALDEQAVKQMVFIYNAVTNGWTVKKLSEQTFSFKRRNEEEQVSIDDFVDENKKFHKIFSVHKK